MDLPKNIFYNPFYLKTPDKYPWNLKKTIYPIKKGKKYRIKP